MRMATQAAEEVVDALFESFAARDFERAREFLSDETFSYQSPIESFTDADEFIASISRVGPILERIERCKTFVKGNDVCSVLKIHTTMDRLNAALVVQITTVVDGKITAMDAVFDATEYNKMIVTGV
jgi:hypothetical protein